MAMLTQLMSPSSDHNERWISLAGPHFLLPLAGFVGSGRAYKIFGPEERAHSSSPVRACQLPVEGGKGVARIEERVEKIVGSIKS